MNSLVDTNIFLEILLNQSRKEDCKKYIEENVSKIAISDFTLNSIGIILFKYDKEEIFVTFTQEIVQNINVLYLPLTNFVDLVETKEKTGLDYDDSYQFLIAKKHKLEIVTLDKDFKKVEKEINVKFL